MRAKVSKKTRPAAIKASEGVTNVFAAIGVDEPEEALAKAQLVHTITGIIKGRGLTQAVAAKILGTDQAKISALKHGRLHGFSMERLIGFVAALGRDVEIRIGRKKAGNRAGHLSVVRFA